MSNNFSPPGNSAKRGFTRRKFLLQALGLGAAGLAVGGGAAWTKSQLEAGAEAVTKAQALQTQLTDVANARAALGLSVSSLQTQLARLQVQFDAVLTQNSQLATSLSATQQEAAVLQTQLSDKQAELDATSAQLANSKQLINLYDLLDGVNLDAAVTTGIAAVIGGFAGSLTLGATVQTGLARASAALADFEAALPDLQAVVAWVGEQVVKIKAGLMAVELAAQRVVTGLVTGLEAVFGGFIKFILDHLPFGLGENVSRALSATHALLLSLPAVADGLNDNVLAKISPHVTEGAQHWKHTLVEPVREQALVPTGKLLNQLTETNTTFANSLQTPVQTALDQRAALRQQIAAFRTAHNL